MVKECKDCGGTGLTINDKYCRCKAGERVRLIKANEASKQMRKGMGAKESMEAIAKGWEEVQAKAAPTKFNIGDWVTDQNGNGVALVTDVRGENVKVTCRRMKERDWFKADVLELAPVEVFPEANEFLIDLALLTGDKDWFNELTEGEVMDFE